MTAMFPNFPTTHKKKPASFGALAVAAILMLLAAVGSLVWAIWELRSQALRDSYEASGNLATVLAGQLSRSLDTINVTLAETRDHALGGGANWQTELRSQATHNALKEKLARLPNAFAIAVADINGDVVATTAAWPAPKINVADRDYFQNARAHVGKELAISSPIRNRVNGEMTLVFARGFNDPYGNFAGVAYVSVPTKAFAIIYDSIKSARDIVVLLAQTNGAVLVRHPSREDVSGQKMPAGSPWYETVARGGGRFVTPGKFGGVTRMASTRLLEDFPLAVSVSVSEPTVFAEWRRQATILGLGGFALVACSLSLLIVAGRKMRSLATSEASLREKSESLERSIAERTEMEKRFVQSQKMEAVGQLTGGIAHDFNNLLLVIIGNLDLLKDTASSDAPELELIESSLTAALAGSELSNSLLAFSRQHAFKLETLDVRSIVDDQVRLLKRAMGRKVTLEAVASDNIASVMLDAAQLRCALTNLVVNARDAMPEGGAITVRTANVHLAQGDPAVEDGLPPGDYVVMEVADSGVGITPENLSRIFDPFFTTKEVGKGSGLGLSMVYGFVKEVKGKIKVASQVGKGTTFSLFFPAVAGLPAASAPSLVPVQSSAGSGKRIFVVDDDDLVRKAVIAQIKSLGYDVIEASSPGAALTMIDGGEQFDLLFSDIVMPGPIDGVELARQARIRRPGLKVLLTSGFPDLKIVRSAEESYSDWDILKKPYRRNELQNALKEALSGAVGEGAKQNLQPERSN